MKLCLTRAVSLFTLSFAGGALAALPDLTQLSTRGSYAFSEYQLSVELNRVLPETEKENVRSSGFARCVSKGTGIATQVDCRVSVINPQAPRMLGGSIEFLTESPKTLKIKVTEPKLFIQLKALSEFISCEVQKTETGTQQVCELRLE